MIQNRRQFIACFACHMLMAGAAMADDVQTIPAPGFIRTGEHSFGKPLVASANLLRLEKVALAIFSPDGKVLLTVSEVDKQVHLWSAENGEEVSRFGDSVTHAIYSGNGARVMTWGEDGITRIFDARTGKALRRLEGAGKNLRAATISPDGLRALTCAGDEIVPKIWDTASGRDIGKIEAPASPIAALTFSPDGKSAAVLSGDSSHTPGLALWDIETQKPKKSIILETLGQSVYFSANGKLALVVGNGAAKTYDLDTGQPLAGPRTAEECFPAGSLTGDRKTGVSRTIGSAAIINVANGEKVRPLEGAIEGMTVCNAFSNDGARVILGTGKVGLFSRNPNEPGKVYVYEVGSGKRLAAFDGHAREVTQVGLSADATRAFSRDGEKTVFLWAVK